MVHLSVYISIESFDHFVYDVWFQSVPNLDRWSNRSIETFPSSISTGIFPPNTRPVKSFFQYQSPVVHGGLTTLVQLKPLIQLTSLRLFQEFIYTIDSQYRYELFIKTTRYVPKTYEFISYNVLRQNKMFIVWTQFREMSHRTNIEEMYNNWQLNYSVQWSENSGYVKTVYWYRAKWTYWR